jgi:hypothetical protein
VQHEPCRLLSNTERPHDFVATDAVFAIGNHPDSGKPLIKPNRRIFKDSPDLDRELRLGVASLALPYATRRNESNIGATAGRASNRVWPTPRHQISNAVIGGSRSE